MSRNNNTATRHVALVTGATSGVGNATAIALAAKGFEVFGTGRNTAGLTSPGGVTYLDLDVTSDESVEAAVAQVMGRTGRIDVLVNNAAVGATGAAEEFSVGLAQEIFDVNVFGVMRMTRAVVPHMRRQQQGRIINVSSVSGFVVSPFMSLYVASKHAIEGYSGSLDHEVRGHGVRVLLVEPGPIKTPFAGHAVLADEPLHLYAEERRTFDELIAKNLRAGNDPADVAKVIVGAALARRPKLQRTAGAMARVISASKRILPARMFDRIVRKFNQMPT